jgi:undecaprenyl pyrophosphate phosphatase UppP
MLPLPLHHTYSHRNLKQAVTINIGAILAVTCLFVPKWYKVWKVSSVQLPGYIFLKKEL